MSAELDTFVRDSLLRGIGREDIGRALTEAGWPEDEVTNALRSFAEVDFPVPVPRPKPYFHAREAFLYLVSFIALYISAFSLAFLFFIFIDWGFPDPLNRLGSHRSGPLTESLAAVIVAYPLYVFLMWRIYRAVASNPERRQSWVRRWLTYLTLVVGAGIIIADLIALLSNFLQGDLSIPFVLKVVAILVIVGTIFGYYLWDIQEDEGGVPA